MENRPNGSGKELEMIQTPLTYSPSEQESANESESSCKSRGSRHGECELRPRSKSLLKGSKLHKSLRIDITTNKSGESSDSLRSPKGNYSKSSVAGSSKSCGVREQDKEEKITWKYFCGIWLISNRAALLYLMFVRQVGG